MGFWLSSCGRLSECPPPSGSCPDHGPSPPGIPPKPFLQCSAHSLSAFSHAQHSEQGGWQQQRQTAQLTPLEPLTPETSFADDH